MLHGSLWAVAEGCSKSMVENSSHGLDIQEPFSAAETLPSSAPSNLSSPLLRRRPARSSSAVNPVACATSPVPSAPFPPPVSPPSFDSPALFSESSLGIHFLEVDDEGFVV
ncbi:hypothetical protein B0O80DRAFT_431050 [Mortierella sp. GBAus27b]|nr:hypothetical protein B0O80DRAFT_431050 [Mortierella sp. GBAus27b]